MLRYRTTVSLIVPVLNASPLLPGLFDALRSLDPLPDETLFVDNGSTDRSRELLASFVRDWSGTRARVLVEGKRGATAARNAGIRAASGEILAFTDSDCRPSADWLAQLVEPFADSGVGGVAGRVEGAPHSTLLGLFGSLYTLRLPLIPRRDGRWTPAGGGYPTANFAVRSSLARELGGFDEQVEIYGEDYDFCARLYGTGVAIEYNPQAVVAHHHRTRLTAMLKQAFGFGRGHAYMIRRHGASLLWIDVPSCAVSWTRSPVRAWLDLSGADKKLLALATLGAIHAPLWWLLAFYIAYLVSSTSRRARLASAPVPVGGAVVLAALLLLKSAAMTAGRWWGSVRYRCLCL